MLDNTSFNLDKTMVKGAQRGRFGYEENGVVIEHLASISSEKMCITSGSLEHDEVVLASDRRRWSGCGNENKREQGTDYASGQRI